MSLLVLFLVSMLTLGESLQDDLKAEETERVVGGKPASEGDYPWTVALYNQGEYICSGSIISNTSILTAAHCVITDIDEDDPNPGDFYAIAGVADRNSKEGTFIEFKSISVPDEYDETTSDIAILETTAPIVFNEKVQKICIANEKMGKLNLKCVTAMGWGQTNRDLNNPNLPERLQFTKQIVVSNLKCSILFLLNQVPDSILCATGLRKGICSGDSGGPLVYYAGKRPVQVGVASYINNAAGCAHAYGPAAWSRVSSFTQYIMKTATGDVCVA